MADPPTAICESNRLAAIIKVDRVTEPRQTCFRFMNQSGTIEVPNLSRNWVVRIVHPGCRHILSVRAESQIHSPTGLDHLRPSDNLMRDSTDFLIVFDSSGTEISVIIESHKILKVCVKVDPRQILSRRVTIEFGFKLQIDQSHRGNHFISQFQHSLGWQLIHRYQTSRLLQCFPTQKAMPNLPTESQSASLMDERSPKLLCFL